MKTVNTAAGLLLAPLAWFLYLQLGLAIASSICSQHSKTPLWFIFIGCVAAAGLGWLCAWRMRSSDPGLRLAGMAISAFAVLLIVAQTIPNLLLRGCE